MNRPNFFIVGAPKCGTTSLAAWLNDHPGVFMPSRKEINFFNTDHRRPGRLDLRAYEALFQGATERPTAVGEATVWYLYSRVAIPRILEYSKDARFIVCLRNPVEMAHSLHEQQVFNQNEPLTDFAEAWEHRVERPGEDVAVPADVEPLHLAYGEICRLGEQLERAYELVSRDRLLTVFLDDMKRDPPGAYDDVLSFLGLPPDDRASFPALNPAKEVRFPGLKRLVRSTARLKRRLGMRSGLGVLRTINRANVKARPRPPLSEAIQRELRSYFREDVGKLGRLTGRDLRDWVA